MEFSSIEVAAKAIASGQFVVVLDDESRENEGDLILAAQFATPERVAFMVAHTNGLLCVPITEERAAELALPMMVAQNQDRNGTAFSITCDAVEHTTTGASACDRALTTRLLSDPTAKVGDFNRPGHMLPLVARHGGVLVRGGHTEAGVDLCRLAGCRPTALICELMVPAGFMMCRDECFKFAREHNLPLITTAQLVSFRNESQGGNLVAQPIETPVEEKTFVTESYDRFFMRRAIELAEQGRMSAPPNPHVGCLLVKNGAIIGSGFHQKAGDAHAEVNAIADANRKDAEATHGCTAYVTLEPCHHTGRTGPCDQALIKANVSRVVVCVEDPDSRVSGGGIEALKQAGISVTVGVCRDLGLKSLKAYMRHRQTGKPLCVLKVGLSLDGKTACMDNTSQWITGEQARADVQLLRASSQAILVGRGTAVVDQPRLNVRVAASVLPGLPPCTQPLRVVLDRTGKVITGPLLDTKIAPTLIFTTKEAATSSIELWKEKGVEVKVVESDATTKLIPLDAVLTELGSRGILQLMVEGGSTLHTQFITSHLADEIHVYKGSTILGVNAKPWITDDVARTIADANFWLLKGVRTLGHDVCLEYEVKTSNL
eukprot:m.24365 g.24365  ORF g.24365 m.24365 type:complete len:602 (+) comp14576_c0_seq1:295-2100(+)